MDSLKEEKTYASRLRDEFEFRDLFLNAIQEHQWDFMDTLLFLDSSPHRLPDQVNTLLKISQIKSYIMRYKMNFLSPAINILGKFSIVTAKF